MCESFPTDHGPVQYGVTLPILAILRRAAQESIDATTMRREAILGALAQYDAGLKDLRPVLDGAPFTAHELRTLLDIADARLAEYVEALAAIPRD
jgi:hypothetical protein